MERSAGRRWLAFIGLAVLIVLIDAVAGRGVIISWLGSEQFGRMIAFGLVAAVVAWAVNFVRRRF